MNFCLWGLCTPLSPSLRHTNCIRRATLFGYVASAIGSNPPEGKQMMSFAQDFPDVLRAKQVRIEASLGMLCSQKLSQVLEVCERVKAFQPI